MALDRTWFNTLVDDDGSGMTGSVWDKADVDSLMDAIDAEIARLDEGGGFWTPVLQGLGGGTPSYAYRSGVFLRQSSLIHISGRVTLASKGSLAGALTFAGLPFVPSYITAISVGHFGGMAGNSYVPYAYVPNGAPTVNLTLAWSGASGTVSLDASHILDTFDIIFGGTYRL